MKQKNTIYSIHKKKKKCFDIILYFKFNIFSDVYKIFAYISLVFMIINMFYNKAKHCPLQPETNQDRMRITDMTQIVYVVIVFLHLVLC